MTRTADRSPVFCSFGRKSWGLGPVPFFDVKTRRKCRRCRSRNKNVWDLMPKRAVGTQSWTQMFTVQSGDLCGTQWLWQCLSFGLEMFQRFGRRPFDASALGWHVEFVTIPVFDASGDCSLHVSRWVEIFLAKSFFLAKLGRACGYGSPVESRDEAVWWASFSRVSRYSI